jgi:hypothetical protein
VEYSRRGRWSVAILTLLFVIESFAASPVAVPSHSPSAVEAVYFLAKFVRWPAGPAEGPFVIGFWGKDALSVALAAQLGGRSVFGRPIELREVRSEAQMRQCQILVVGRSERQRMKPVLDMLQSSSVLTVAAIEGFPFAGGMVQLAAGPPGTRLTINTGAARRAGLEISSKLLRISTVAGSVDGE